MIYRTFLAVLLLSAATAQAGNWPHWRGPFFNGTTDETNLPTEWSQTENITWSATLPGVAASTPIVWDNRVYMSGTDADSDGLITMGFDRTNGKLLWKHEVGQGVRRDYRSTFAASSPVTDGKNAIFFFGSGQLVCYDADGKQKWFRNIEDDYGQFAFQWTFATSPTLFDGKLYIQVLQRDVPAKGYGMADRENKSYLLALDPGTGKTLWQHFRPSDAVAESREAFTTPIPFKVKGRDQLLVIGGDALTGHDPATGKELWRWGDWNPQRIPHWRHVPSPVAGDDIILVCAPKRDPIYAIMTGGQGPLGDGAVAWVSREDRAISADVPTPAFYDGDFFVLSDVRRSLSRVEPATGKTKWTIETPGRSKYEASPTVADGKVYLINFDGQVCIVNAENGDVECVIPMDSPEEEHVRASISVSDGQLFIRTTRTVYCVGKRS